MGAHNILFIRGEWTRILHYTYMWVVPMHGVQSVLDSSSSMKTINNYLVLHGWWPKSLGVGRMWMWGRWSWILLCTGWMAEAEIYTLFRHRIIYEKINECVNGQYKRTAKLWVVVRWKTSKTNRYTHVINSQDLMVPMVLTTCKTQRADE